MEIENLYIKRIEIDSYRSLKSCNINLESGLNILIGQNGAGKSNLLDFIYLHASRNPLRLRSASRGLNTNFTVNLAYEFENKRNILSYTVERIRREEAPNREKSLYSLDIILNKTEDSNSTIKDKKISIQGPGDHFMGIEEEKLIKELSVIRNLGRTYITFSLPKIKTWVSKPNRLVVNQHPIFEFTALGFSFFTQLEFQVEIGLGAWLDFSEGDREQNLGPFKEFLDKSINGFIENSSINDFLNNYTPIQAIRLNPNTNIYLTEGNYIAENLIIDFLVEGDWIPWSYLSDGTKRLFYLVSECLTMRQGIILIEEPELGIHPHQLLKILDFLKEQSRTKQIIISTHSPISLDILTEYELDKIKIAKYDRGTQFRSLSKEEIEKAKKYMNSVGELSYYWLHSDLEK